MKLIRSIYISTYDVMLVEIPQLQRQYQTPICVVTAQWKENGNYFYKKVPQSCYDYRTTLS